MPSGLNPATLPLPPVPSAKNKSTSRKGTRQETDEPESAQRGRSTVPKTPDENPELTRSRTHVKRAKSVPAHSTGRDTNTDMNYWDFLPVGYIRDQVMNHYGMRFGDPKVGMMYTRPRGGTIPAHNMTKVDYLRELKKVLNQPLIKLIP